MDQDLKNSIKKIFYHTINENLTELPSFSKDYSLMKHGETSTTHKFSLELLEFLLKENKKICTI